MDLDPNNPQKEYTGVWIPAEVMECDELSATDKITYGEIACFKECYASNAWLAKRIGKSEHTARNCVGNLIQLGFVEQCGWNGRFRVLRAVKNSPDSLVKNHQGGKKLTGRLAENCQGGKKLPCRVAENCQADWQKIATIDKSIEQSKDNILPKGNSADALVVVDNEVKEYGNSEINEMFREWEKLFGYKQKSTKQNRMACYNLLRSKDRGKQWLLNTMRLVFESTKDRYAGKNVNGNANFADIQRNQDAIWLWGRRKHEELSTNPGVTKL